jgi:hypothetical protein
MKAVRTRPPKIRFPPGTFVRLWDEPDRLWEVVWLYRMREEPNVWLHVLKVATHFETSIARGEARIIWSPVVGLHNTGIDPWSYSRIVSTPNMIRLAEIAIDDIMES